MTDREKVIKGIRCCMAISQVMRMCEECPYRNIAKCYCCEGVLGADALALLREQEPVKPIFDEEDVSGRCGVCGHALTHQSMVGDVLVDEWFQYCPICGRKVDWNA